MLPFIDTIFGNLAGQLGASQDELKLVVSFFVSYPLAALLKRIPDNRPDLKNGFIVSVAVFYLVGLFDLWAGVRTLLVSSAGAYLISYYITGPYMPWIGFVFLMGHMSVNHIYRHMVNDPSIIDITGAQMVLVMKLTAFCWNVHDGRLDPNLLDQFQKEHALTKLPNLLDFAGFVLFFPSLFAGPAFDYVEYKRWLETTMFDLPPGTDPAKAPPTRKSRRIPRSGWPSLLKASSGTIWLLLFLQLSPRFPGSLLLSNNYMSHSILGRIFLLNMVTFTTRTKYYAVWALAEGACILSGIGYKGVNPTTNRVDWNRLQNVNPLGMELAQNTRAYLGNWNINTNNWLRNYMYLRVTPRGRKPGFRASLATFVTSAFWHGFEPGYYLAFVLAAFLQTVAKNCRRLFRPFFLTPDGKTPLPSKRYYDIASWAATQLAFSYTVCAFILLSFTDTMRVWKSVYFYAVIGVVIMLAFFSGPSPGQKYLRKRLAKRTKAFQDGKVERVDSADEAEGEAAAVAAGVAAKIHKQQSGRSNAPLAGLPDDPGRELDEVMDEVRREVELRRSRGMSISQGLQEAVQEKVKRETGGVEDVVQRTGVKPQS